MSFFDSYRQKYSCLNLTREDGILEARLHTNGGPLLWGEPAHRELGLAFADFAADPDNRIIILAGTGDIWCETCDPSGWKRTSWETIYSEGRRLYNNFLDIDAPVIAAINGPARWHACLPVLADIVLASETALFQDQIHFQSDTVPGDANQLVWPALLGYNRGRYFLFTGREMSAREAFDLGVVNEILPPEKLLPRAWEMAREFNRNSALTLRYTRRVLNQEIRERMRSALDHGLPLEGLVKAAQAAERKAKRG